MSQSAFVGVFSEGGARDDGATNVEVAAMNEFGIGVPERSFIRATINENRERYNELNKSASKKITKGQLDTLVYLENLGQKVADDMKNFAVNLSSPANAESTIKQKKSSNPLIDTTQMVNSITYVVQEYSDDSA